MKLSDFSYLLPDELIAHYPTLERTASRLLCLSRATGKITHHHFSDIGNFLNKNDLLVFNNTKVIPARLYGQKATGGKVEILVERILPEQKALVHLRASKTPKPGNTILLEKNFQASVEGRENDLFILKFHTLTPILEILEKIGHMPLPPYMQREDQALDAERYQTVYAEKEGSVAAPTAGLHFDDALLAGLAKQGVQFAQVTLHVGAGTFQPVRVEDITQHKMHAEWIEVPVSVCDAIKKTRERKGRVIAVGTTTVRSLETASQSGEIKPYTGETDIFIYPGYQFKCIDAMTTNFHLSESSLLMLVSAFAGREAISNAYETAIKEQYRFFSYGDAMLIV